MDRIPAETLDGILDYVLIDDGPTKPADCTTPLDSDPLLNSLKTLRLVCKTFRDAVADRFWRFFEDYSILLERNSLKKLKRIAQNKHTRSKLHVIWIFTYQFKQCLTEWPKFKQAFKEERAHERKNYLNLKMYGQDELPFTGTKIMKAYQAYKHLYEQQEKMKNSGERKVLLSEIFELLDGYLAAVNICGGWCGPPFRPITEKIGISHFHSADEDEDDGTDKNRAVCDIIQSLYWSRIRLCGLNWICADSDMLDLPDRTLRFLRKSRTGDCQFHNIKFNLASNAVSEEGTGSVHKVLQACPNVETLELKFPSFSTWQVDIRYLFGTKHYEHLAHLHIAGFTTNAQDLAKLMYRHRDTLECIELCDIILEQGSWASLFKLMHDHLKLTALGINQLFQPGITLLHCPYASKVVDYALRKTDKVDWLAFQKKSLCRTPNRFFAVDRLTEMLGMTAVYQAMILEPAFWLNNDQLTSDGPQELSIKEDEGDDLDWEIDHGFITDPESDDDDDDDESTGDSDSEAGDTSEKGDAEDAKASDAAESEGWETEEASDVDSDPGSDPDSDSDDAPAPEISVAEARFAEFSDAMMQEMTTNPGFLAFAALGGQGEEEEEDDDMDDEDDPMPALVDEY